MLRKPLDISKPASEPSTNKQRLYSCWRNVKGIDCKMIGPETKCLCDHRYKEHNHSDLVSFHIHCKQKKCKCPQFFYIPTYGSYDFKCLCKHSYKFHDPISHRCLKGNCGGCNKGFNSAWTCACGCRFNEHTTVFENTEQRRLQGKTVDDLERMMGELDIKDLENQGISNENDDEEKEIERKITKEKKNEKLKALNEKILIEKNKNEEELEMEFIKETWNKKAGEDDEDENEISALSLYIKPHGYIRYNIKI